jgi:hypothetical protein
MEKPKISYSQLISEALVNSSNNMLAVKDIYKSISYRHPYYKLDNKKWQNCIRHTMTLSKIFKKTIDNLGYKCWTFANNKFTTMISKIKTQEDGTSIRFTGTDGRGGLRNPGVIQEQSRNNPRIIQKQSWDNPGIFQEQSRNNTRVMQSNPDARFFGI